MSWFWFWRIILSHQKGFSSRQFVAFRRLWISLLHLLLKVLTIPLDLYIGQGIEPFHPLTIVAIPLVQNQCCKSDLPPPYRHSSDLFLCHRLSNCWVPVACVTVCIHPLATTKLWVTSLPSGKPCGDYSSDLWLGLFSLPTSSWFQQQS